MPIAKVQLPDGRIARLEVEEGTTPQEIEAFVAQQLQNDASQQQPIANTQQQPPVSDNPLKKMADWIDQKTKEPNFVDNNFGFIGTKNIEGLAGNIAQGRTFGFADEIGSKLAPIYGTLPVWALKNALPESMGGERVSIPETFKYLGSDEVKQRTMAPTKDFAEENPTTAMALQIAGAAGTMATVAKMIGSGLAASPTISKAIQQYPRAANAGGNFLAGSLYGAGVSEGTLEERALPAGASGAVAAGVGAVLPSIGAAFAPLARPLGNVASRAVDALKGRIGQKAAQEEAIATAQTVPGVAQQTAKSSPTGILPLSKGVREKDVNMLRIEENARQGLLGFESEMKQKGIDEAIEPEVMKTIESLTGVMKGSSRDISAENIDVFRTAAEKVKESSQKLFKLRDAALTNSIGDKRKIGFSLGKKIDDAIQKDKFAFKRNPEIQLAHKELVDIIKKTQGKEIQIGELIAWRGKVTDMSNPGKKTPKTQPEYLAGKLGAAFDDWLENDLSKEMIISGPKNVGQLVNSAKTSWAAYKQLYEPTTHGASSVLKSIVTETNKTPRDFVSSTFGTPPGGAPKTAQIVREFLKAIPKDQKQEVADNIFKAEMSKILESSKGLAGIREGIGKLRTSDVFKESLSTKQRETVLNNLYNDLDQFLTQSKRRDVASPSGGHVGRILQGFFDLTGKVPVVGRVPKVAGEGLRVMREASQKADDRATLNKAIKEYSKELSKEVRSGKLFDPRVAVPSAVIGGKTQEKE